MINEDGDLINYSDGEDPNVTYYIDWDKIKTFDDLKTLLKPAMVTISCDLSTLSRDQSIFISSLLIKKIIK